MQGVQKAKCISCGIMFMSETDTKTCPACSEGRGHDDHGDMGGCGCGHSHWPLFLWLASPEDFSSLNPTYYNIILELLINEMSMGEEGKELQQM